MPNLFPTLGKNLEVKDAATARAASGGGIFRFGQKGVPYASGWEVDRAIRDAYQRVLWVFRSVDAIASNESRLPIVKLVGGEGVEAQPAADNDPLLKLLNRRANGYERAAAFRYRLVSQLLLSKRGVFIEVVYNNGGDPTALHLLPPGQTTPIPDPDIYVSGFAVGKDYGEPDILPVKNANGKPNVIWIRKPHPTVPYMGVTPLEAAGLSIDMDYFARLYNRSFLQNDGRPGGLLGVQGDLSEDDAQELKRRFSGGPTQAGRTTVIEADALNWVDTAISPRDAQFAQILKLTKEDVLTAFGVSLTVLGWAADRTYDNADAEREVFWMETMPSPMDMLCGELDAITLGGFDDDSYLSHDVSSVEALQRARLAREARLMGELKQGAISIDEYREAMARNPFGTAQTRALWIPTVMAIGAYAEGDEPEPEPEPPAPPAPLVVPVPAPLPVPTPEAEPVPEPAKTVRGTEAPVLAVEAALGVLKGLSADAAVKVAAVLAAATHEGPSPVVLSEEYEANLSKVVDRFTERQARVVAEKVLGPKLRKGTVLWEPAGDAQVDALAGFDRDRWDRELTDEVLPVVKGYLEAIGGTPGDTFDNGVESHVTNILKRVNDEVEFKLAKLDLAPSDPTGPVQERIAEARGKIHAALAD